MRKVSKKMLTAIGDITNFTKTISMAVSFINVCLQTDVDMMQTYANILSYGFEEIEEMRHDEAAQQNLNALEETMTLAQSALDLYSTYARHGIADAEVDLSVARFAQTAADKLPPETIAALNLAAFGSMSQVDRLRTVFDVFYSTVEGNFFAHQSLEEFLEMTLKQAAPSSCTEDQENHETCVQLLERTRMCIGINDRCRKIMDALMDADKKRLETLIKETQTYVSKYANLPAPSLQNAGQIGHA